MAANLLCSLPWACCLRHSYISSQAINWKIRNVFSTNVFNLQQAKQLLPRAPNSSPICHIPFPSYKYADLFFCNFLMNGYRQRNWIRDSRFLLGGNSKKFQSTSVSLNLSQLASYHLRSEKQSFNPCLHLFLSKCG